MLDHQITQRHELFTDFYKSAGLEIDAQWIKECCPVFSVAVYEDGVFRGAAAVSARFGEIILDYIAVTQDSRGRGTGSFLVRKCLELCRSMGCAELLLAARVPLFFKALGAVETSQHDAVLLGECRQCPDYMRGCEPKQMKFVL